jgi:hypothetical protein
MRLSWKDAGATALVVVGLSMALSVTQGWDWPLLGGVREGIVALAIAGLGACLLASPRERSYFTDPFGLATMLIVVVALVITVVGGLIIGSVESLVALMLVTTMMWAIATVRHAVEGGASRQIGTTA